MSMSHNVLLLNQAEQPLTILSWKRALTLIFSNKADVVSYSDVWVDSISRSWNLPSIIRMDNDADFHQTIYKVPRCTKKRIHIRDGYVCAYCGKKCKKEQLTVDHIHPESLGGKLTWINSVTSCRRCNNKKANKTLEESGMVLLRKPYIPSTIFELFLEEYANKPDWKKYLDVKNKGYRS